MDAKYLAEIKAREQAANEAYEKLPSGAVIYDEFINPIVDSSDDVPALLAEVERLQKFCDEWCSGEDHFQETVAQLDCANAAIDRLKADNAAKDQQIATLKRALEIASSEVNKAFETLESHHVITMTQKASGIQENVDTWVHLAQEQEGKE